MGVPVALEFNVDDEPAAAVSVEVGAGAAADGGHGDGELGGFRSTNAVQGESGRWLCWIGFGGVSPC